MTTLRCLIAILALLVLSPRLHAQKEANIWYFGYGLGLDFNTVPPTQITNSSLYTLEGSASIADPTTGELLFYTDGIIIWNRDHKPMPNGKGLLGDASSTQSALIVPAPGDSTKYFVFTADAGPYINPPNVGIHYSIVDMKLDGGRGDVTVKNVQLLDSATEKLTGIRHCNGHDYWVIAHGAENDFYAYPITNSTAPGPPIISRTGSYHSPLATASQGYMKASPDGRHLGLIIAGNTSYGIAELFRFNALTGVVSHPVQLEGIYSYGLSFSPDGTKLYMPGIHPIKQFWNALYQFEVQNWDSAAIMASRIALIRDFDPTSLVWTPLQIAPDGKIYLSNSKHGLLVILNPNLPGLDCNFMGTAWIPRDYIWYGLPNFIDGYIRQPDTAGCELVRAQFISSDTILCAGQCINFFDQSIGNPYQWNWTFEGATVISSHDRNPPSICYPTPGTYTVVLITSNDYAADTARLSITVESPPYVNAGSDLILCIGDSIRLSGEGNGQLQWGPATGLSCDDCATPTARPDSTTTYFLTAISEHGCIATDSVTITVTDKVRLTVNDARTICRGESTELAVAGANQYHWFPSAGLSCSDCPNPVATPDQTTTYYVTGGSGKCSDTASIIITVRALPAIDAGDDISLCDGESAQLSASGGIDYHWSPSNGLSCTDCSNPIASPLTTTRYRVDVTDNNGCVASDSVLVTVLSLFTAEAGSDQVLCSSESATLTASDGVAWHWFPADGLSCTDCQKTTATPSSTTTYHVTITNADGCTAADSVTLHVLPVPSIDAGKDLHLCVGQQVQLHATGSGSFIWTPQSGLSCTDCPDPIVSPRATTTYHVTLTDANGCTASDSITVAVNSVADEALVSISRNHRAFPGQSIAVPITLHSPVDQSHVDQLRLYLGYAPHMLRLDRISVTGTLLDGWKIDSSRDASSIQFDCTAPAGAYLTGTRTLAVAHFTAFLGDIPASELPLSVDIGENSCLAIRTEPGLVQLDSVCGLSYRLVASYGKRYALDEATPNPFNPTADIRFSLGLDGPTQLVVFNASGEKVAVLVDDYLQPGTYQAIWDATEYPAGLYYYRLTSGAWSATGMMVLKK